MTTATGYESFTLDVDAGVGRVRFTQGDRGNPFDASFCRELAEVVTACDVHPDVRCVLIEGAGRFFSVGGDLASLGRDRDALTVFIKGATIVLHSAVSLAAAADFCLAGRSAKFYAAYQGIGLAIDGGGSHFLPRRVGSRRATDFYLRNQTWDAEEACRLGLVSEVVEDEALEEQALALARELAAGPTRSFGEVKNLLASSADTPLETQLELEARAMSRTAETEDTWEGITAVAAKRRPSFRGA
jgi:2-(1,2-epoxy-1,2-dihydrophenyl)acetyl-CoA isomerase